MVQRATFKETPLPLRSELNVKPASFADTTFQAYAEKIADDYAYIIKNAILPGLTGVDGLKLRELRILACVYFFTSPLSPAQVSDLLRYDPATVTRAVSRLVEMEKIVRIENQRDTRSVLLKLTQSGKELAAEYANRIQIIFAEYEKGLLSELSDEEKTAYLNVIIKISNRAERMRKICHLDLKLNNRGSG